jgi:hypothetical protein
MPEEPGACMIGAFGFGICTIGGSVGGGEAFTI